MPGRLHSGITYQYWIISTGYIKDSILMALTSNLMLQVNYVPQVTSKVNLKSHFVQHGILDYVK